MIQDVSTESLCHLAKIVLENNLFEFCEKKFKQKLGTAIGTKFAPSYGNLFMARLERLSRKGTLQTLFMVTISR